MYLTEAYLVSIPESFLVLAISIIIVNGLVGIPKPAVKNEFLVQNLLVERLARKNAEQKSTEEMTLPENYNLEKSVEKSAFILGILSLCLTIVLVSNLDIVYIGRLILDEYSKIIKICVLFGSVLILLVGFPSKAAIWLERKTSSVNDRKLEPYLELVILISLAIIGLMVIISSYDLLSLYIGIELQSLALYVLAAYKTSSEFSTEAGLKYFILGALASGLLLFGTSILYGLTGSLHFEDLAKALSVMGGEVIGSEQQTSLALIGCILVLSGLFFKASIAPFHQWTPDVYEGSPMLITLFFASVPKLALFSLLARFLTLIPGHSDFAFASDLVSQTCMTSVPSGSSYEVLTQLFVMSASLSMLIGSITGLFQLKLKRLLAYSTLLNMGYLVIGLLCFSVEGLQALFFYLFLYLITNLGLFTLLLSVKQYKPTKAGGHVAGGSITPLVYLTEVKALRYHPLLALSLLLILASLAGFPPLAGFFAKLYLFFSALSLKYYLLSIIGVLCSVVSSFYYLRLINFLYFSPIQKPVMVLPLSFIHSLIISVVVFILVGFFLYPGPLLSLSLSLALHLV